MKSKMFNCPILCPMERYAPGQGVAFPPWLFIIAVTVIIILTAAVVVLSLRLRRYRLGTGQDNEHDPVTGIGNKAYFSRSFNELIETWHREGCCLGFICFDIEHVNRYYGETVAEEQLRFAANELILAASKSDIIARVSGGGFAVAHPFGDGQEIRFWVERLIERLNRYMAKYGKDYRPDFHMGIYTLQPTDRDCEAALANARQGYLRAVSENLPYVFSHQDFLRHESEMLELKKQTIDAIQNREFRMYLQFLVSGGDGRITGAEALSRWEHPQKGLLYPGSYVELMESDRTISALDFFIFEEVCKQLELWNRKRLPYTISCNFARISIDSEDFISQLQEILELYRFPHSRLIIEITEDTVEGNRKVAFDNIYKCKEMGFRIALDDAGSGCSSFSDLRDYPIDIVKIDRSILTAAVDQRGISLLHGMISLIHSMHMEALCEGVETASQRDMLRILGCDYIQGYYFYRAMPVEEAERIILDEALTR